LSKSSPTGRRFQRPYPCACPSMAQRPSGGAAWVAPRSSSAVPLPLPRPPAAERGNQGWTTIPIPSEQWQDQLPGRTPFAQLPYVTGTSRPLGASSGVALEQRLAPEVSTSEIGTGKAVLATRTLIRFRSSLDRRALLLPSSRGACSKDPLSQGAPGLLLSGPGSSRSVLQRVQRNLVPSVLGHRGAATRKERRYRRWRSRSYRFMYACSSCPP
jgi:hypothetical protein